MTNTILALIEELDRLGQTHNDAWQISRAEGELLHQIALAANARVIIEIGTSYGFSGLFWGAALLRTGGLLHTIDINPAKVESSKATFAAAGLGAHIVNHCGSAIDILKNLNGPFDLVFIDADKAATREYFDHVFPKLRAGGSILIDNATTHRKELSDFIQYARDLPNTVSMEVAVGNGVEWVVKSPPP